MVTKQESLLINAALLCPRYDFVHAFALPFQYEKPHEAKALRTKYNTVHLAALDSISHLTHPASFQRQGETNNGKASSRFQVLHVYVRKKGKCSLGGRPGVR